MSKTQTPDQAAAAARSLLDGRIAAVRELAAVRQQTYDMRDGLAAQERADDGAHRAAVQAGWAPEELRRLGLDRLGGAPRRPGQRARARRLGSGSELSGAS